ncbi:MAG TPA: hypothetical protein VLI93_05305 [Acetobacteraceae bacterium]|nr:hypothetical protein [Acetobacteraceae bacterium]
MSAGSIIGYVVAAVLIVWALARRSNWVKARSITGNVAQVRDNSGSINQTYSGAGSAENAGPDRVAWAIGIIGVLVAVAALVHDIFWAK